ncbi:MAG: hypothetical protein QOJ37_710 [Pseudonocardiales bacterium]|jgi:hypothetical protein|nr:hypothetical protein [Jatrophihabitans sp.]MDT4902698.1 hypothetical protein [Pseudonocardiales bacterium]MDT4948115.1 hypothetical protein [Pseudonocardiales bacterium]
MRKTIPTAVLGIAVAAAATLTAVNGAGATTYQFVGYSGGSLVRALNNTVTSDLTAASAITTSSLGTVTNTAAGISVPNLLTAGAVSTSTSAQAVTGGYKVVSHGKTAGVKALNGLITADALDTTTTSSLINGKISGSVTTTLVGVKIAGINLPVKIPQNYHVTIPNIASVYLNYSLVAGKDQSVMTIGSGLLITLLKPQGANAIGAAVSVNLTYAALGPILPPVTGHSLQGNAYGTSVSAKVGSLVNVQSDPTAPISVPGLGTAGVTRTSNIAGVALSPTLHIGAVTTTATGTNTNSHWESETTAEVAGINLLNGLITADAVKTDAHVNGLPGTPTKVTGSTNLVHLKIAGALIPIDTSPNTVIKLLNIGTVTVNQQVAGATGITVRGLVINLSTAAYGLPAGAQVQVASSSASAV